MGACLVEPAAAVAVVLANAANAPSRQRICDCDQGNLEAPARAPVELATPLRATAVVLLRRNAEAAVPRSALTNMLDAEEINSNAVSSSFMLR